MGMFDRFIIDEVCPGCGEHITEIQSKQLGCYLDEWEIGDDILFPTDIHIDRGYFIEDAYCQCNTFKEREWKLHIEDGKFDRVEKINKD